MIRSKIVAIDSYLPERIVDNEELEKEVNSNNKILPENVLERMFGIKERRFAAKEEQVSDLAVKAADKILDEKNKQEIDFLIFAAACADLIEPATGNIVQTKLGLKCPCMDIKNACNSVVSALQTADAFIRAGIYKNILIVNGEKPSDAIRMDIEDLDHLKRALSSFTLGDAGTALIVSKSDDESGIYFQKFMTEGSEWEMCTIKGGGSMHFNDSSKFYFEGKTAELKDAMILHSKTFFNNALKENGWDLASFDHIFTHQISANSFKLLADNTNLDESKFRKIFKKYGNTVSASIPLSIADAMHSGSLNKGDKILVIGLAAGLSASVQTMIW